MEGNMYIRDLTVAQLRSLILSTIEDAQRPKRTLEGNKALAEFLGCSISTIQRYKAAGVFRKACFQRGRTIVYDANLVLECFRSYRKN